MPAYSNTPLAKKLGIKDGFTLFLVNAPEHYLDLFPDMPVDIQVLEAPSEEESIDFIHFFGTSQLDFTTTAPDLIPLLNKQGLLWVSWPKASSKMKTDLKRDWIREYMLGLGLVDVKVASVDDTWSGLKFVYRLEDR